MMLAGCGGSGDDEAIPAFTADELTALPEQDWITNGGTVFNQRYSPLDQINPSNVSDLKGVWRIHLGSATEAKYSGEAQPLVHDGVAYISTGASDVFALDVESGKTIWKYEGKLFDEITTVCCGWTSRGVAIGDGRVYLGKLDGKLVALDASSGEEVWSAAVGDWKNGETITSAPLYYDGLVVTGISGGEFGVRGSVTAYDAETGKQVWRFYTIPGPGETGHETWPQDNDAWKHGGAPVWQTPAVDPELGLALLLDRQHVARLRRQQPQGRQPVRELDRRPRRQDGRVPVALPAGAPRHLGPRLTFAGRALRPEGRRRAAARSCRGEQDGLGLHPRQDERQASHRDRRARLFRRSRVSTPLRRSRIRSAMRSPRSRSRRRKPLD